MKLTLTLSTVLNLCSIDPKSNISAIGILGGLTLSGDQAVLLSRAIEAIGKEWERYGKLRNDWIRKHGDKSAPAKSGGEDSWTIPVTDLPRIKRLIRFDRELLEQKIEVRLVKRIALPSDLTFSANQYRTLLDAGLIEPLAITDDEEKETAKPATNGEVEKPAATTETNGAPPRVTKPKRIPA